MSEYYAVQRSTDHLAHYGVRGMKWGVRRALDSGNSNRLARNYKKAQKKLAKLDRKADLNLQKNLAEKYRKKTARTAAATAISGAAALGGLVGTKALAKAGRTPNVLTYYSNGSKKVYRDLLPQVTTATGAIGSIASKVGMAKTLYDAGRTIHHKRLASKEGHAAAVSTRDHFKKEMKKAFKGTKFENLPDLRTKNIQKKRKK